jgi:hypothetical protein
MGELEAAGPRDERNRLTSETSGGRRSGFRREREVKTQLQQKHLEMFEELGIKNGSLEWPHVFSLIHDLRAYKSQVEETEESRDYFQREMNSNYELFTKACGELLVSQKKVEEMQKTLEEAQTHLAKNNAGYAEYLINNSLQSLKEVQEKP